MKKMGWILSTLLMPVLCFSECPCKNKKQPQSVAKPTVATPSPSTQREGYITSKASILGFNPTDRDERVLTRIAIFFRINTPEEAAELKKAVLTLPMEDCERVIGQFDGSEITRSALHLTSVFLNLYRNASLGATPSDRMAAVIVRGLPFVALVIEQQRARLMQGAVGPLNFLHVADIARREPDLLLKRSFKIDDHGNVIVER